MDNNDKIIVLLSIAALVVVAILMGWNIKQEGDTKTAYQLLTKSDNECTVDGEDQGANAYCVTFDDMKIIKSLLKQ